MSTVARFNRGAYKWASPNPLSVEAKRYASIAMQADASSINVAEQLLQLNPTLQIYEYTDPITMNSNDLPGITHALPYDPHSRFILRDGYGNPIQSRYYGAGALMLDISNPACLVEILVHIKSNLAKVKPYKAAGTMIDNLVPDIAYFLVNHRPAQFQYASAWFQATAAMCDYLGEGLTESGFKTIGNIGGGKPTTWQRYQTYLTGAQEEAWTCGLFPTPSRSEFQCLQQQAPYFAQKLANLEWSNANGKLAWVHTYLSSHAGNSFALAAMLLVANGGIAYECSPTYAGEEIWFTPEFPNASKLGLPKGVYVHNSMGLFTRPFENGHIIVNPTAAPIGGIGPFGYHITITS